MKNKHTTLPCQAATRHLPHATCQNGYTLIEILMAIGIATFVIAAVVGIQLAVKESYNFSFNTLVTVDHANGAVQEMGRAVRNARSADNGAYALVTLSDQEIIFYGNSDDDAGTERIRYFLEGNELKRGVIEPSSFPIEYPLTEETVTPLTEHVQNGTNPVFYYYNEDYPTDQTNNPLVQAQRLSQTSFMRIVLTINATVDRPEAAYELEAFAQIRNLKTNL